jgi:hypothetical protein
MQHPFLLVFFICLHCSSSVAPFPSEPDLGLGFQNRVRHDAFPDGFHDYAADAAEHARCESTQSNSHIAPNVEERAILVSREMARDEQELEEITGVKSSVEKQRRQIIGVSMASGIDSNPHSIPTETDTDLQVDNNHQCAQFNEGKGCRLDNCRHIGGRCVFVIRGGIESCQHGRLLRNGTIVEAAQRIPGCGGCGCRMYPGPKKFEDSNCLMTASKGRRCKFAQAQECYNAGARCNAIQITDQISKCTEAHFQGAEPSVVWNSEVCQSCECARKWPISHPIMGPIAGTGRRGWGNMRLSIHANYTGVESERLRSAARPRVRESNPKFGSNNGANPLLDLSKDASFTRAETETESSAPSGLSDATGKRGTPNSRSSSRKRKQSNPFHGS